MSDFGDFMKSLPDEFSTGSVKAEKPAETFPCQSCAGTGLWKGFKRSAYGPVAVSGKCFSCNGKGEFKKSYADRQKAKEQRQTRKAAVADAARAVMIEEHGQMIADLTNMATWHSFAASLIEQFNARGDLSDKQIAAAYKVTAKNAERQAERTEKRTENSGQVDMTRIREMFDTASGNGLKRPRFRTETLDLSLAPMHGKNPGAIYVKSGPTYCGKIVGNDFQAVSRAPADTLAKLVEIAKDPTGIAVKYGRITGSCGCCGRELTKQESIDRGIGPICADKWGL
jgi:hypothetical protein